MNEIWILLLLILAAALPVIIAFCLLRRGSTGQQGIGESKPPLTMFLFLVALASGILSLFIATLLQNFLPYINSGEQGGPFPVFFNIFFRIALAEELSRIVILIPLFRVIKRRQNIDVSFCAAMGLVAGLGFAMLESAFYGLADVNIALLRAFTAAPLHGACGIRAGVAVFFFARYPVKALFVFIFAVLIHGAYNMMIVSPALPSILAVLVALTALFSSLSFLKATDREPGTP